MSASENQPLSPPSLFVRRFLPILLVSFLLIVPCFWHPRIEAGDLPSHVYNAWLAQLITKGQAPGLYLAQRSNNVLFDLALFRTANAFGLAVAEKIVVALCVLVFSWGVFSFIGAASGHPPWFLLPCIAMLAYGYCFHMGFLNYYLSIGLACFALALTWNPGAGNWLFALLLTPFVLLAHPIGFFWLLGTFAYRQLRQRVPGWWKCVVPASAALLFVVLHWYLAHAVTFPVDWERQPLYLLLGNDQLMLFGDRYAALSWIAAGLGVACLVAQYVLHSNRALSWKVLLPPLELYGIALLGMALLPENLRPSVTGGWIGLLVSRLSALTAIFGLIVLSLLPPRKWHLAGFAVVAAVFFAFLYQDTRWLNRLESNAESVLARVPYGARIIPTIAPPPDWRVIFISHIVDRACIGRCFTYSNYEPASGQFRVRVRPEGSPIATSSEDDAEDMEGGSYEIQETDPPLFQLYQCDRRDPAKLCLRTLHEGDTTSFSSPASR